MPLPCQIYRRTLKSLIAETVPLSDWGGAEFQLSAKLVAANTTLARLPSVDFFASRSQLSFSTSPASRMLTTPDGPAADGAPLAA